MKKIKITFILTAIAYLSGCSVNQVIDDKNPGKPVNGYQVEASNYNKIKEKNVKLEFKVAKGAKLGEFDWESVKLNAASYISEKGVKTSASGKPITIIMDGFIGWDRSQFKARKSYGTGISGGTVLGLGGSVLQGIAASIVEAEVTESVRDGQEAKKVCESNCIPEASFSIQSEGYQTNVNLKHTQGFSNYVSMTEKMVSRAIADMFEPVK